MTKVTLNKRLEESKRKKAMLLETAASAFGELGYKALSMEQLAERAGISKGLIFAFYGSKKALFTAVIEQKLTEIHRDMGAQQAKASTGLKALEVAFRCGFEYTQSHTEMYQLFSAESQRVVPEKLAEHKQYWINTFEQCLRTALAEGDARSNLNVSATARSIYHLHKALLDDLFAAREKPRVAIAQDLQAAVELIVTGVRHLSKPS